MNPQEQITVEGRSYPLLFNSNASYKLEMYLMKEGMGTVGDLFKRLLDGRAGMIEIHQLLWASLEGGRTRDVVPTRPNPFTLEEVGQMIDKMGGLIAMAAMKAVICDTVRSAAPDPETQTNAEATAGAIGPNARAGGTTGMRSSRKQRKSGSSRRRSGA